MQESLQREHTLAEHKRAQDIACAMVDALPTGTGPDMVIGALSLIVTSSFGKCIKTEYRLAAFDEFAAHCRKCIEREARS